MSDLLTRRALVSGAPSVILSATIPACAQAPSARDHDPIFTQVELHKELRHRVNTMPEDDDDPAYLAATEAEEAAIQALGEMQPTSIAAAAAQLSYMAEVEGDFHHNGSPLLQTVLSVARGLASIQGSAQA